MPYERDDREVERSRQINNSLENTLVVEALGAAAMLSGVLFENKLAMHGGGIVMLAGVGRHLLNFIRSESGQQG